MLEIKNLISCRLKMIPITGHNGTDLIDEVDFSSDSNLRIKAELNQKYFTKGVQMGASFADYIERKKTGMNYVKRMVLQEESGCNVKSHNIRPERVKPCEAKSKVWKDTCYPKMGQGAKF
jgi:hypothetical protein